MLRIQTIVKLKEVNIKAHRQVRINATATLWIIADWANLPPLFVFKGQPAARVDNKIIMHLLIKSKQIFNYLQTNTDNNQIIMKKWVDEILSGYSYLNSKIRYIYNWRCNHTYDWSNKT